MKIEVQADVEMLKAFDANVYTRKKKKKNCTNIKKCLCNLR